MYEYKVIPSVDDSEINHVTILNTLGRDGWELVAAVTPWRCPTMFYFKRVIKAVPQSSGGIFK